MRRAPSAPSRVAGAGRRAVAVSGGSVPGRVLPRCVVAGRVLPRCMTTRRVLPRCVVTRRALPRYGGLRIVGVADFECGESSWSGSAGGVDGVWRDEVDTARLDADAPALAVDVVVAT